MEEKEYLGISDFSMAVHVKPQGIYERISKPNNAIHKYIRPNYKPTQIHVSAIEELYGIPLTSALTSTLSSAKKCINSNVPLQEHSEKKKVIKSVKYRDKLISSLERQIEEQRKALEQKDKFIDNLMERLKESERLLDQEQQLSLAEKKEKQILLNAGITKENNREESKENNSSKWYHFWKRGGEKNSNVEI